MFRKVENSRRREFLTPTERLKSAELRAPALI
jgi:hypothetical protein